MLNRWNKISMRFTTPSLNSKPHSIRIDVKLCEIIGAEVFAFSNSCNLESRSRSILLVWNVEYNSVYHHTKFESNWFIYVWMLANVKSFSMQSVKQNLFPLFETVSQCSAWIASPPHQISSWSDEKCWKNEVNTFCFTLTLWSSSKVKVGESGIKW